MKLSSLKDLAFLPLFALFVAAGMIACSGDDDDDSNDNGGGNGGKESFANVSPDEKPFIGIVDIISNKYNSNDYPSYHGIFYQDHKCRVVHDGWNDYNLGLLDWSYDSSTKRLVIGGIANGQWEITSTSDTGWTGLSLWSESQGYVAKKDTTTQRIWDTLREITTWSCGDVYINKWGVLEGVSIGGDTHEISYGDREIDIFYYDPVKDVIRCETQNVSGRLQYRWHTIKELYHPYSYNGMYMDVFTEHSSSGKTLGSYSGRFLPEWKLSNQ